MSVRRYDRESPCQMGLTPVSTARASGYRRPEANESHAPSRRVTCAVAPSCRTTVVWCWVVAFAIRMPTFNWTAHAFSIAKSSHSVPIRHRGGGCPRELRARANRRRRAARPSSSWGHRAIKSVVGLHTDRDVLRWWCECELIDYGPQHAGPHAPEQAAPVSRNRHRHRNRVADRLLEQWAHDARGGRLRALGLCRLRVHGDDLLRLPLRRLDVDVRRRNLVCAVVPGGYTAAPEQRKRSRLPGGSDLDQSLRLVRRRTMGLFGTCARLRPVLQLGGRWADREHRAS